jgi:2-amino-4-hydroxy-6-hydroxymethyldihydropteridine diphosphokinase
VSTVVLSIGSNVGDRLAHLQSVVDGLGQAVRAVSPVYETDAWGGVEQGPFLNAVLIDDDQLTLPHPYAHQRAFVLVPWLAVDADATLTVHDTPRSVADLLAELDATERDGVRPHPLSLVT